jgi:hypothetical protein
VFWVVIWVVGWVVGRVIGWVIFVVSFFSRELSPKAILTCPKKKKEEKGASRKIQFSPSLQKPGRQLV